MRIRAQGVAAAAAIELASACAAAAPQPQVPSAKGREFAELRAQHEEQTRRIEELEARLTLLEAEARRARDADGGELRAGQSVRIAPTEPTQSTLPAPRANEGAEADDGDDADGGGPRPSLRLYGGERGGAGAARSSANLPAVPEVSERLPVVPLPEQRTAETLRGVPAGRSERAIDGYREGLRFLRGRRFEQALATFSAFVARHPNHELVPSALYWRGEALYAKRDYGAARQEFEALLSRFPTAARAPDALLKLGLSLRKLGAQAEAKEALERLRTNYPQSQAAQTAAREGST